MASPMDPMAATTTTTTTAQLNATTTTTVEECAVRPITIGGGPETMMLHPEEVLKALQIKHAVQEQIKKGSPAFRPLSDFMYVHYAVCTPGEDLEMILHRIAMMEAFKQEYKIQDTVEEGTHLINQMTLQQPGFYLSVEYLSSSENYLTVVDFAEFYPERVRTHEQFREFLGGTYYHHHAKMCQFRAIRNGTSILAECEGARMLNFDHTVFDKMLHEFARWYPENRKEMYLLSSPGVVNFCFGLWKKYMTPNMKSTLHLGHKIQGLEGQRIDHLYKTPTAEAGRQHFVRSAHAFLQLRYLNEREFKLPTGLPTAPAPAP